MREREREIMGREESVKAEALPLFDIIQAKGRVSCRLFSSTVFFGICLIWLYRLTNVPGAGQQGRWSWIGMFMSELVFGFYWILNQPVRWNVSCYLPFKDRLLHSYEDKLPGVDIFVCTADPIMEPPAMVINTILSVMAYNYSPEKLSIYLSDDGGSNFTFYALLEAAHFSKRWIPFCRKFNIEPRSPEAYFSQHFDAQNTVNPREWSDTKKQYEDMKERIEAVINKGRISEEIKNHNVTKQNHRPIVKIVIDGRDKKSVDNDGIQLPTVVYLAREKKLDWPHNFKAGAMNALIRVSSEISNGDIILNLDCDMYANDADAIREALCFFMDEQRGHQIAYVQHPQNFNNITNNDIYGYNFHVASKVELPGLGGYGAALYCGTGCFHRRNSLCGSKYSNKNKQGWNIKTRKDDKRTINELEERSKVLASCCYEKGTQWGKEMGLVYGCPVEDIVTGLTIQCRGWKSVYYNPEREAFLGVAPTTLDMCLVQFKRWSEGMFQIFFSRYCPFIYGHKKIKLGAQMGYCIYLLWAPLSLPALYYVIVPPLYLLHGIPLFPKVSSLWFIPFAYVFLSRNIYSMVEALRCGSTLKVWWNLQRMVTFWRTTSFFFAFVDTIIKKLGLSQTTFVLTAKVAAEDVSRRYEQEIMEFGSSSVMFTIIATLAMVNLICLAGAVVKTVVLVEYLKEMEGLISQVGLCALVVMLNAPVFVALFLRKDKGCLPFSVMFKSVVFASLACLIPVIW